MLRRLFLSVILSGSFMLQYIGVTVEPVAAASENLVIAQLQTSGGGSGTATEEIVVLYNSSASDRDISNWCIEYSSASDNTGFTYCLTPPDQSTELWVSSAGFISIATEAFLEANLLFASDFVFSGGMATSSGHLRLFDAQGIEQDKLGWGDALSPETEAAVAHTSGELLSRDEVILFVDTDNNAADFTSRVILPEIISGVYEVGIIVDTCANLEGVQVVLPEGYTQDENGECYVDICPLLEGLQVTVPDGYEKLTDVGACTLVPLEDAVLFITELLPNAPSIDTGNEFIELYNPLDRRVELKGYVLQIGPSYTKEYVFTDGAIAAGQYEVFSDIETGIVLPNTTGQQVRLISPAGEIVSSSYAYSNAADDESWALVEDVWIWTNQITPQAANKAYLQPAVDEVLGVTSVLAPCSAGKYRNPDTNRCKTIESAVSILQACDEDEYRNVETNRCRKSSTSTSSSLTPCRSDQERNPATNRCRSVAASTSALQPCEEGKERNPETNRCRNVATLAGSIDDLSTVTDIAVASSAGQVNWAVISVTLLGTMGYMFYEWRVELSRKLRLLRLHVSTR